VGRGILAVSLLVIAGSFMPLGGRGQAIGDDRERTGKAIAVMFKVR
jgi:hypothetical protein